MPSKTNHSTTQLHLMKLYKVTVTAKNKEIILKQMWNLKKKNSKHKDFSTDWNKTSCKIFCHKMKAHLMSRLWENQAGESPWSEPDLNEIFREYPLNTLMRHCEVRFSINSIFPSFYPLLKLHVKNCQNSFNMGFNGKTCQLQLHISPMVAPRFERCRRLMITYDLNFLNPLSNPRAFLFKACCRPFWILKKANFNGSTEVQKMPYLC